MLAAFSFYEEPRFSDFSLSQVAAKVGISKTAIFRHFANKDALLHDMQQYFFDTIAQQLLHIQELVETPSAVTSLEDIALDRFILFLSGYPQYIYYLLNQFISAADFEQQFVRELELRGIDEQFLYGRCLSADKKKSTSALAGYMQNLYCTVTIMFFLQKRMKFIRSENVLDTPETFAKKLVFFMAHGVKSCVPEQSNNYPVPLSSARIRELDQYCSFDAVELSPEDRIFTALASVINKSKFPGVTVERIAEELHMAKSSLYSYFSNKNELIRTLISREMESLIKCIQHNYQWAQNSSECIYIQLRTEFNYFMKRPSVIPVCGWLRMSGSYYMVHETDQKKEGPSDFSCFNFLTAPDIGMPLTNADFAGWISALPVTLILQGRSHGIADSELSEAVIHFFNYIEYGIDGNN